MSESKHVPRLSSSERQSGIPILQGKRIPSTEPPNREKLRVLGNQTILKIGGQTQLRPKKLHRFERHPAIDAEHEQLPQVSNQEGLHLGSGMGLLLGQAEGPGREGDGRGRAGDAEEGGMLLHEAHEGPFADEAHVLLEVAEEEGLGLGLDEGAEVENHGWLLAELHYSVKFGHSVVRFLLRPSSAARFLPYGETSVFRVAERNAVAKHRTETQDLLVRCIICDQS